MCEQVRVQAEGYRINPLTIDEEEAEEDERERSDWKPRFG
jgi:hypothetical protein